MLDHTESTTAGLEAGELQTISSLTINQLISTIQATNVIQDTLSSATAEQDTLVSNLRIGRGIEANIQSRFKLSVVSGSTSSRNVTSSIRGDLINNTIHRADRLAVQSTAVFLREEDSFLNINSVESSTFATRFSNVSITSDNLRSASRISQCPSITEDLRKVGNTNRDDANSRRTARTFFESRTDLVQVNVISNSASSDSTNTTTNSDRSSRSNSQNQNNFFGGLSTEQHTRNNIASISNSESGSSAVSNSSVQINHREDHGLSEEAMLNLNSGFVFQHRGQAEQRSRTIRHQTSNHRCKRLFNEISRSVNSTKILLTSGHFNSFSKRLILRIN